MFGLLEKPVVPTPTPVSKPALVDPKLIAKYKEVASAVGYHADFGPTVLDEFFGVMHEKDWPIYPLARVIRYMDIKAGREGKHGWWWVPLRSNDHNIVTSVRTGRRNRISTSDFYNSAANMGSYNLPVPMHALQKVQAIEEGTRESYRNQRVAFFVTDYAPKPQYQPDPFLMAMVPVVREGRSGWDRFIIDFWDEPGFGIAEQLDLVIETSKPADDLTGFSITDKKIAR